MITLRPATPADEPFQLAVYTAARAEELAAAPWNEAEKEAFLRMQYAAQYQGYTTEYPQAEWYIVQQDGQPIGRLIVDWRAGEVEVMDMALLPEYRNQGIGTELLHTIMATAAQSQRPVRLYVEKNNPGALRLYRRLGFMSIGDIGTHWWLAW